MLLEDMLHPLAHISPEELPQRFTYPFHYEAHPLCRKAAEELQAMLIEWQWDKENLGKMFGVLIVHNKEGELGYLWAYSGNITPQLERQAFVPPIFDLLNPEGFFIDSEKELTHINKRIATLKASDTLLEATRKRDEHQHQMLTELEQLKGRNKAAKKARKEKRELEKVNLSTSDFNALEALLIQESQREKSALKQVKNQWTDLILKNEAQLATLLARITLLKEERQNKSGALQQRLFDQYQLLNANKEVKSLCAIFQETLGKQPPAAAGDCAAPRLLQYAYTNEMQPLAMAEFWWGKSPKSIIRKTGHYYPSCRGKCEPILGHMLQGLDVDDNPLYNRSTRNIEIIHEDEDLLVINKPAGLLSVAGKTTQACVLDQLKKLRPDIESPIIVHRLDMATSGLLLIAKSDTIYKALQAQFISRQVKKRYEALLDGIIKEDAGKIDLPLRVDLDNRPQQMVCYEHGKAALTVWKVIERKDHKTRIAFYPITGRTHQLRVHAAHPDGLNTPIIGDELYGTKDERLHLHAAYLEFTQPNTKKTIRLEVKATF